MPRELKDKNRYLEFVENPPFPQNILFEVTNCCNHKCVFCVQNVMRRRRGICDRDFAFSILEDAYANGAREVGFYANGEPLLVPFLPELVCRAKTIGYRYTYIDTNGAIATKDSLVRLIDAGIDSIKFSINASSPSTYKLVHGSDDFEKVKDIVTWLSQYVRSNGIHVGLFVSFIKCSINKLEIDRLHKIFDSLVDKVYSFDCINVGGVMGGWMSHNDVLDDDCKGCVQLPCPQLFNRCTISYEGFLTACCSDADCNLAVADLNHTKLIDAWNCETFVSLRRQHLSGVLENNACYNCVYWTNNDVSPLCPELLKQQDERKNTVI